MKRKIFQIITFISIFFSFPVFLVSAQPQSFPGTEVLSPGNGNPSLYYNLFDLTYGENPTAEHFNSVVETDDGDIIAVGKSAFLAQGSLTSAIAVKFDSVGNLIWKKNFGNYNRQIFHKIVKGVGGYAILGVDNLSTGTPSPWVIFIDTNGNTIWERTYGNGQQTDVFDIQLTRDSGFIIAGRGLSCPILCGVNAYLLKIDSSGNIIWNKEYDVDQWYDTFYSVVEANNGYIAVGRTDSNGDNFNNPYIVKVDLMGNIVWEKAVNSNIGSGNHQDGEITKILKSKKGGYILLVNVTDVVSYTQLVRIDENGEVQKSILFKDPASNVTFQRSVSMVEEDNGDLIIVDNYKYIPSGSSNVNLDIVIHKFNSRFVSKWAYRYGDLPPINPVGDYIKDFVLSQNHGYILAGFKAKHLDPTTQWWEDGWLLKVNKEGKFAGCQEYRDKATVVTSNASDNLIEFNTISTVVVAGSQVMFSTTTPQMTPTFGISNDFCSFP